MFSVIYEFIVAESNQQKFLTLWHDLTEFIKANYGGRGSKLHKALDRPNTWIAYASWPDQITWQRYMSLLTVKKENIIIEFEAVCQEFKVIYQLGVVEDLLFK